MHGNKHTFAILSLVMAAFVLPSRGDYKDDSEAVKVSGGEDHTLVLTADKAVWACGPNGGYEEDVEYYWGVLGTGNTNYQFQQKTLVRVHGPDDVNYLEVISDIDAGWKHSLALDVNAFVWSWGFNSLGELGVDSLVESPFPVQVLRGDQPDDPSQPSAYLKHIIAISAGRSGQHSLGVDANGFVYAWGRNQEGQCGPLGNGRQQYARAGSWDPAGWKNMRFSRDFC